MLGNLVNAIGIVIGSLLGLLVGKKIKKEIGNNLLKAVGICVIVIGLSGAIANMISVSDGKVTVSYTLELLIFLSLGALAGNLIKIEDGVNKLGDYVEKKINKGAFSIGFVNASLVFCVGAMAVLGPVEAAVDKTNTILFTKAAIDAVTAFILASTLGYGVVFSSISVFIYQSLFYLLGLTMSSFLNRDTNPEFFSVFCMVGYSLVFTIGINFLMNNDNDKKIKVANMLPSILFVIIYYVFKVYVFKF